LLSLTKQLADGLLARGANVLSPGGAAASGIVSFRLPNEEPERTTERLFAKHIHTIVRRGGVRASPHFYIDEAEIDTLLDAL
jgi:selenocysteine lyase/cysteine desulfurase